VGERTKTNQAPDGAKEDFRRLDFCRPCRGLDGLDDQTHGFTVGCYLPRLRRWGNHFPRLVRKSFSSRLVAPKRSEGGAKAWAKAAGFSDFSNWKIPGL
jgi:hypothetical protein